MDLDGARKLLGGGVRVALDERGLGDRVGERRERVRMPGVGGDPRERVGARVRRARSRRRAKNVTAQRRPQTA